jgi:predicted porin
MAIIAVAQVTEKMVTAGTTSTTAAGSVTAAVAGDLKNVSNVIGLRVPMGATTFNASYTSSTYTVNGATTLGGKGTQLGLQAIHALSKRTVAYIHAGRLTADLTDLDTVKKVNNYGIGIHHSF